MLKYGENRFAPARTATSGMLVATPDAVMTSKGSFCLLWKTALSLIALCALILTATVSRGATIAAASAALSDVSAAVSSAATGDTVTIPAGNVTWSSGLSLNKPITLQGAGTNATIINSGGIMVSVQLSVDKPVRISGIRFNNQNGGGSASVFINGRTYNGTGTAITAFRVDHCFFNYGTRSFNPKGWCYGVVDHCTFLNCNIGVGVTGDDDYAWQRPIQPGTTNCVCIEDNNFVINNSVSSEPNEQVYHQEGTRTIIRHNNFDGTAYTAGSSLFLDAHGNNNVGLTSPSTDFRGTIMIECYSNVFHAHATYRMGYYRGGTLFIYGNTYQVDSGSCPAVELTEEEDWSTGVAGGSVKTVWPAQDQITNTFVWNNMMNGSPVGSIAFYSGADSIFIQQGRDYWMQAPGSNNGLPTGVYAGYRPLVYPHPLVSPAAPPTSPVAQLSVASLNYAMDPNTGSSNKTVTVQNVGAGTLSGSVAISTSSSPSPWSVVGSTTYSLAANASATITVRYTPTSASDSTATLTFTDNGGGGTVALSGGRPKYYIWPVGDSITQGHDVPGGYRLPLYQMLTNAGINAAFVGNANDNSSPALPYPDHDGYGGYEISDLAAGVDGWSGNIPKPNCVLLMVGLNDFRHNDNTTTATNRLESLIAQIASDAPNAQIIVADLNPWTNLGVTNATMELLYNPYIPGVVAHQASLGHKVSLCDMRGKLSAADLETDNTHPTQAGYNKIAAAWLGLIPGVGSVPQAPSAPGGLRVVSVSP